MPDYVASGKDACCELSFKVTADDDLTAFVMAKARMPIVSKLERIQPDGELLEIAEIPLDDIPTELVSAEVARLEESRVARESAPTEALEFLVIVRIGVVIAVLLMILLWAFTCVR